MKGWVIFVLAVSIYFVSIFGGFIQDDVKVIAGDTDMGKAGALISVWTRPYYYLEGEKSVYRPLTSFSFYVNALITGKEAWGFRLGNVLIYGWVCWLVFVLFKIVGKSEWAFWGALLFVALPIHTEVVNNIVGRSEMLALGFILLAVLKNLEEKWDESAVFFLLAMLSKETAVVGVPILIYFIWTTKRVLKIPATIFVIMALLGFLVLRTVVLGGAGMMNRATLVENPLKFVSTEQRVMNAIALVPFGVEKIFFPLNLSYDYSYNQIKLVDSWFDWRVVLGIIAVGLSIASFLNKDLRKDKLWIMGMMLFWGPVLITGNILFPIGTIFGERLWFLPSLGLIMIAMFLGSKTGVRFFGFTSAPIFMAILLLFAGRTVVRNLDWLSQERLFLHDVEYASGSVMAQSNAAAMFLMKHDLVKGSEFMETADRIYPKYPELLNNWGMYYLWIGKPEQAEKKFEKCLIERPGYVLCLSNLELVKVK